MNSTIVASSLSARIQLFAYAGALPLICVLGIAGNVMNLTTLASRRLRAVSYMYLRALAACDLLCMLFVLGFVSGQLSAHFGLALPTSYGRAFYQAHFMLSLINWSIGTGVLIVVALTLERYVSIVFPMHFRTWNSPRRAIRAILLAYVIPAFVYTPYGIGRYAVVTVIREDGSVIYKAGDSAVSKTTAWQVYEWSREILLRFAPLLVLSVLNVQIMVAFRRRQKMVARLRKRSVDANTAAREDNLLYLLGGTVVMFFICNVPAAINLLLIDETRAHSARYQLFRALANLLEIANHASQFYVFCACSTDYRATFLDKFPCFREEFDSRQHLRSLVRRAPPTTTAPGESRTQTHEPDTVDVPAEECRSLLEDRRPCSDDSNGVTYL